MIVVDTNIIAFSVIPGEKTLLAQEALRKDPIWFAPLLWRSELTNVLTLYMRKNILSLETAQEAFEHALVLMQSREIPVSYPKILELTAASKLSAYDCEFLFVAQEMNLQLLTEDKLLLQQFPQVAIKLDAFVTS